jgi:hypothetical protein
MKTNEYCMQFFSFCLGLFALVLIAGVILTCASIDRCPTSPVDISGKVAASGMSFRIVTGLPGIVFTLIGFAGIVLLLIKIPVREILLGIGTKGKLEFGRKILLPGEAQTSVPPPQPEHVDYKIPLLFYWLFKGEKDLRRVDK